MYHDKQKRTVLVIALSALLLLAFTAMYLAENYDLSWWTPEGGGGGGGCYQSTGYALCGAIGQADAGSGTSGGYQVDSGFWVGPRLVRYQVHLPMLTK
jgi:hypothetical protein